MRAHNDVQISVDLVDAAYRLQNPMFAAQPRSLVRDAAERYRKFLWLCQKYPDRPLAPTRDIDEMWHIHMLHPRAYFQDCMANFGEILDHDGGFGTASEEEAATLHALFERTAELWRTEFGEEYAASADGRKNCVRACAKCAVRCRKSCKKSVGTLGVGQG